jgi:hypothetical protein
MKSVAFGAFHDPDIGRRRGVPHFDEGQVQRLANG